MILGPTEQRSGHRESDSRSVRLRTSSSTAQRGSYYQLSEAPEEGGNIARVTPLDLARLYPFVAWTNPSKSFVSWPTTDFCTSPKRDEVKHVTSLAISIYRPPSPLWTPEKLPRGMDKVELRRREILRRPTPLRSWLGSNSFSCNVLRSRHRQGAGCKSQYFTPSCGRGSETTRLLAAPYGASTVREPVQVAIFHAFEGSGSFSRGLPWRKLTAPLSSAGLKNCGKHHFAGAGRCTRLTSATPAKMIAMATISRMPKRSPNTANPSSTATTGFT